MTDFSVYDKKRCENFCCKTNCNHLWDEKKSLEKAEPDICRAKFIIGDFSDGKIKGSGNH